MLLLIQSGEGGQDMTAFCLLVWALAALASAYSVCENNEFRNCPAVEPLHDFDMEEMVGPWHLSLLLLDSDRESFEEVDVCIKGQIEVYNQTSLKQQWRMLPTKPGDNPEAKFQVTTLLVRPAVWLINTPLGGQLKATVVAYKRDEFAVVVHCGWQHGDLVHMWTAAITRSPVLTPQLRLQLTSALINTGYQPSMTKVITWSKC